MVYYNENDILIRTIEDSDAKIICEEECAQGWNQTEDKYRMRIADHKSGRAISLVDLCGYRVPWCRFAQRLWKRSENVLQERISPRWFGGMVS